MAATKVQSYWRGYYVRKIRNAQRTGKTDVISAVVILKYLFRLKFIKHSCCHFTVVLTAEVLV